MSVCRISVRSADREAVADLVVCARTPVGELLPALVELVASPVQSSAAHRWRLDRLLGRPLTDSLSLRDNGVDDGDTLVLTGTQGPTLGPIGRSAERVAADTARPQADSTWHLRRVGCAFAAAVSTVMLACNGSHVVGLVMAALGTCALCGFGLATRSPTVAVSGTALAAAAGFLAVPSGAFAASAFLASCTASAATAVLTTLWRAPSAALTAAGCLGGLCVCTTGIAMFAPLTGLTTGALLAIGALAVLAGAPRLSAVIAIQQHAETAHEVLTGLVAGSAAGSAAGLVMVALHQGRDASNPLVCGAFGAAVAICLLLRVRTFVDGPRRWALLAGGLTGLASVVAIVCSAYPGHSAWAVPAVLTVGLVGLRDTWPAPWSRGADLVEYAVLAAVPPLACWVIGVYDMARTWMP